MPLINTVYAALERLGKVPLELYTFARGDAMWRLAAASGAVTVPSTGLTYEAAIITRSRLVRSEENGATSVRLRLGLGVPVAQALREIHMNPMACGIHRYQPGTGSQPVLLHYGDVAGVSFADGQVEIIVASGEALLEQPFPRGAIERQCQWATYSGNCGVSEAAFSFETTIASITRSTVIVDAIPGGVDDTYYEFGQIKIGPIAGAPGAERVHIDHHIGTELHIAGRMPAGVIPGDTVTLIAGDDRTLATCRDRFNNVDRFTGFDQLPTQDPLQTGLV